jgi:plasmid stability protein
MADILIRGIDEGMLSRLDALAAETGVSRNALIRSIIAQETRVGAPVSRDEATEILNLLTDLGDTEVMAGAWR